MRKLVLLSLLSLFIAPVYSEALPIPVNCPGTASTTDREFTLTTDPVGAECLAYGNEANELNANVHDLLVAAGWTVIDKDESPDPVFVNDSWFNVTPRAMSGYIHIDPAAWGTWRDCHRLRHRGRPGRPEGGGLRVAPGETSASGRSR